MIQDKKILLVDDEKNILTLLSTVLKKEGFTNIITAETGADAIVKNRYEKPAIIILDIMLPDISGYEICKIIREDSMVPILFLSAKNQESDKLLSYMLGGDDYITKPFSPKEIAYRIQAILKREAFYENKPAYSPQKIGDLQIDSRKYIVKKKGKVLDLTAKEYQILFLLLEHNGYAVSKSQLLESVWGLDFEGYDNTLMVHISRLREKLEDDSSHPIYIKTVKGIGYKFDYEEKNEKKNY